MSFDVKAFEKQEYLPREGEVSVPLLKEFFDDEEKPVWRLRGLTHAELAKGIESYEKRKKAAAILDVVAMDAKESANTVKSMLGMDETVPQDTARRLEHFALGSIEPKITIGTAVHLAKNFPLVFIELTSEIYRLTGLGAEAKKKPTVSGSNPISKIASR